MKRDFFLELPRRDNTREAQLTPHKRSAVWGLMPQTGPDCGDIGRRGGSIVWAIRMSIALMLLLAMQSATAQTVSHVTAEQVNKTIHVSYDLDKQADITLFVSTDGGSTYTQLYRVSGDVGENVSAGHKTIVWDVLAEREKLVGENIVFKVKAEGNCPYTLTDYDGNTYRTVKIGEQCWMRENLRTTHYADGTSISHGTKGSKDIAYYFYPSSTYGGKEYTDNSNVPKYGLLYNWWAVMNHTLPSKTNPSGVQGICPNGWHVPSVAEWEQLLKYVKSQNEYMCGNGKNSIVKALSDKDVWKDDYGLCKTCDACDNQSSNNKTGFSARPAGYYCPAFKYRGKWEDPFIVNIDDDALFWSATQGRNNKVWAFCVYHHITHVSEFSYKNYGFSVRCVKN